MIVLLLKLLLAPTFVALVSLAGRRWGLQVAGWIGSFPIVAGPILFFFAIEQGDVFAAEAAKGTLLGLVGFGCFSVVYSWTSRWWSIPYSILASWTAFIVSGFLLAPVQLPLWVALVVGLGASNLARVLMPKVPQKIHSSKSEKTPWDLPLRMTATAALVLGLTAMAQRLGPAFSGVLTPFPVASTVLAGFTHYHHGGEGVARLLRGSILGMQGFALFCAVLSLTLVSWGLWPSFALALAVCGLAQWVVLKVS